MSNRTSKFNQVISVKGNLKRKDEDKKIKSQWFLELNKKNALKRVDNKNLNEFNSLTEFG